MLSALFDRVLGNHERHSNVEFAKMLGVTEAYIRRLRNGWRPGRIRQDLQLKLLSLDAVRTQSVVRETTGQYLTAVDYERAALDGELRALREMMRYVVQRQAQIGAALQGGAEALAPDADIIPRSRTPHELIAAGAEGREAGKRAKEKGARAPRRA